MTTALEVKWRRTEWWVRLYSYIIVGGVIYGVAAAHLPFILGIPWSTCENEGNKLACVLVFHLYDVPLVSFNAFFAWYGLKRFSPNASQSYESLLTFAVVANLAFFTFETVTLLDGLQKGAPLWETLALFSVALMLIAGAGLGVYVKQTIVTELYRKNES